MSSHKSARHTGRDPPIQRGPRTPIPSAAGCPPVVFPLSPLCLLCPVLRPNEEAPERKPIATDALSAPTERSLFAKGAIDVLRCCAWRLVARFRSYGWFL